MNLINFLSTFWRTIDSNYWTHFNAWSIVSSPLVLGFDLRNQTMLDLHWDTISNVDAIEVNQDYAGFSGTLFEQSSTNITMQSCDWKPHVTCDWPTWMSWYKPLSGRDARSSKMAILLMNNVCSCMVVFHLAHIFSPDTQGLGAFTRDGL